MHLICICLFSIIFRSANLVCVLVKVAIIKPVFSLYFVSTACKLGQFLLNEE